MRCFTLNITKVKYQLGREESSGFKDRKTSPN